MCGVAVVLSAMEKKQAGRGRGSELLGRGGAETANRNRIVRASLDEGETLRPEKKGVNSSALKGRSPEALSVVLRGEDL